MSYDLDAFPLPPGRSARKYVRSGELEALLDDETQPTPEQRAAMERAVASRACWRRRSANEIARETGRPWWKIWR